MRWRKLLQGRYLFLLLTSFPFAAQAQQPADTLHYSMEEAEKVFLANNLSLIAEKLNISQADARILQAKAWPNPNLTVDNIQVYNTPETSPSPPLFGHFWENRTFGAQLQQLVYTAQKRKKNIRLEARNKELAQSTFTELLQSLKAEFRQAEAALLYLQEVRGSKLYQLSVVNTLAKSQQGQLTEGNISQAEMYRIKALQISLQAEINSTFEDIMEKQEFLKNLMAIDSTSYLVLHSSTQPEALVQQLRQYSLSSLLDLSLKHNSGIESASRERSVSDAALSVQKAARVPDVTLGVNYDRNSSNQLDFVGAGISMDLPVFNHNKGNIKVARLEVQKSDVLYKNKVVEVNNAVIKNYAALQKSVQLYEAMDKDYLQKLDGLIGGVSRNFLARNISLLEFLDFFESFSGNKVQYYEAIRNIRQKKEDLNFLTGTEL